MLQVIKWLSLQRYLAFYFHFNKICTGHTVIKSAFLGSKNKYISFTQTFSWKPQKLKPQELWLLKLTKCTQRCNRPQEEAPESLLCWRLTSLTSFLKKRSSEMMTHLSRNILKEPLWMDTLTFFLKLCPFLIHFSYWLAYSQQWSNFPFLSK